MLDINPVPVDIERNTLNINPIQTQNKINEKTKAILPVALMGKPPALSIIRTTAGSSIPVVIDACEATGTKYKENDIGVLGDMVTHSLYVSHVLKAGEGGIITTNNSEFYDKLKKIRNHGRTFDIPHYSKYVVSDGVDKRFVFDQIGYNFKMTEIQAVLGLGSLKYADEVIKKRRANFLYYQNEFKNFSEYFYVYSEDPSKERMSPHAFPILRRTNAKFSRKDLMRYLSSERGIDCRTLFQSISSIKPYNIKEDFHEANYVEKNGLHIGVS